MNQSTRSKEQGAGRTDGKTFENLEIWQDAMDRKSVV